MSAKRNKTLKYKPIPLNEVYKQMGLIEYWFKEFLTYKGFPQNVQIHISYYSLIDIIVRVDKRKAYYMCFHDMEIHECKEVALFAYWIIKLSPFTITDNAYSNNSDAGTINEAFAIFLIGFVLETTGRIVRTKNLKDAYYKLIDYSFRFRNFSIDSIIVLIESISTETLERDYPNLYGEFSPKNKP